MIIASNSLSIAQFWGLQTPPIPGIHIVNTNGLMNIGYVGIGNGPNAPPGIPVQTKLHLWTPYNAQAGYDRLSLLINAGITASCSTNVELAIANLNYANSYSSISNLGDGILRKFSQNSCMGDFIITNQDAGKSLRFATTPNTMSQDIERMKITGDGRVGINLQNADNPIGILDINLATPGHTCPHNMPKISFNSYYDAQSIMADPSIRFYRTVGCEETPESQETFPWWIEENGYGNLNFRSHNYSGGHWHIPIGTEIPATRVTFSPNGNVGINNDMPNSGFQVTNSNVIFDGYEDQDDGYDSDKIPFGAGTRFIWLPYYGAIRVGTVGGNEWNESSIGQHSIAFGYDVKASYLASIAIGKSCISSGLVSTVIGNNSEASSSWSTAIGDQLKAWGQFNTQAFGYGNRTSGNRSTTMGCFNKVDSLTSGCFMAGDDNGQTTPIIPTTISDNEDEIVLRFSNADAQTYSFRLITGYNLFGQEVGIDAMHMGIGWLSHSCDSNLKKNIQRVNENDILSRLRNVPIKTWQWKDGYAYDDTVLVWQEHNQTLMSPMAQDFCREFPYGVPDSTHLNYAIIDAVSIASIQALAYIGDSLGGLISQQQAKSSELTEKADSALTKTEFQKFKDTLKCYIDACERIDSLEKRSDRMLAQSEFYSFKDSIKCYADACDRIEQLEKDNEDLKSVIEDLKARLDSLEAKVGKNIKENGDDKIQQSRGLSLLKSQLYDDIILSQNNPNPFAESTEINYYVPAKYNGLAKLIISDENGIQKFQEFDACFGKPCQIKISAKE